METRKLAYLLTICAVAAGGQQPSKDLTNATLEDLLNLEVTSVSKKEQKLVTAPAAIYVITQEDIRRSGLTSIPEILRMVPGLDVAQIHGNQWAISSRGFNGQFANKMLVLIDGRSVYAASDSGVFWDEQDTVIEDIDRIEVIRGPGAALWGANAVNGVINIITKSAADTQGGLVSAQAGNEDHTVDSVRYGGQIGKLGTYRVYSKYSSRADLESLSNNQRDVDWAMTRGGFRTDWKFSGQDSFIVQGEMFHSTSGVSAKIPILTPPFQQVFNGPESTTGGNVLASWSHHSSARSTYTIKAYFDRGGKYNPLLDEVDHSSDVEFQHNWTASERHEIVWGLGFRYNNSSFHNSPTVDFDNQSETLYSAFVQDEIRLVRDRLSLVAGSKFEHTSFADPEVSSRSHVQPSARLVWTPNARTSIWAAVSRAVRTPSYFQLDSQLNLSAFPLAAGFPALIKLFGSGDVQPETLRAHEIGFRTQLNKRFSLDWTGFYNVYHHLESYEPGASFVTGDPQPFHLVIPLTSANGLRGESEGMEIAGTWEAAKVWRLSAAYSWLSLQLHLEPSSHDTFNEAAEGQSPRHQIQFRSNWDLSKSVQFDIDVYHVSALLALTVPAYTRIDARLGWRPSSSTDISVGGQNLQGGKHLEFVSEGPYTPSQVGLGAYARITWRF